MDLGWMERPVCNLLLSEEIEFLRLALFDVNMAVKDLTGRELLILTDAMKKSSIKDAFDELEARGKK